jgi:two-component system response regulator HydG
LGQVFQRPEEQLVSAEIQDRPIISANDLKAAAQEAEQDAILKVLRQVNFNKTKAAAILNIDRKTLYNKMKGMKLN